MASVIIGSYKYEKPDVSVYGTSATVINEHKGYTELEDPLDYVTIGGVRTPVQDFRNCFRDCLNLVEAPTLPDTARYMQHCFRDCISLTTAPSIPSTVSNMNQCFKGCISLTQAPSIPSNVENITGCFSGCSSLVNPPSIASDIATSSMYSCFQDCTSLTTAPTIPSGIKDMRYCFAGCSSLIQAPTIPKGVANLSYCFWKCTSLEQASAIPSSVTNLNCCFWGCSSLVHAPAIQTTSITAMNTVFSGCASLTTPPNIPNGVVDMTSCFYGCSSLTQAPVLPSGLQNMTQCFISCTSLTSPPVIPSSVTNMSSCFSRCSALTTAPTIPNGVTNMDYCFYRTAITQPPEIPASVSTMRACFEACKSMRGNLIVRNNPTSYDYIFREIYPSEVYIINKGSGKTTWRSIASSFSNVWYEADSNPAPVISDFTVTRVSAVGSTDFVPTGRYAYVKAKLMVYSDRVPFGWTVSEKSRVLTEDGTVESPTWQPATISSYPADVWCWLDMGDTAGHTFTLQITDSIKDGVTEERSSSSNLLTVTVTKSYALVDYYHDPNATFVTEGISFGKFAEYADLFDVDMPARFRQEVQFDFHLGFVQMYAGQTEPTGWKFCNGQELLKADYMALYQIIGDTYGTPSDSNHFKLPNLMNRVPVGAGDTYNLNSQGGANSISYTPAGTVGNTTLTTDHIPAHTHGEKTLTGYFTSRKRGNPASQSFWAGGICSYENVTGSKGWTNGAQNSVEGTLDRVKVNATHTHSSVGGGKAHNHGFTGTNVSLDKRQPYLGINFIIYTGVA